MSVTRGLAAQIPTAELTLLDGESTAPYLGGRFPKLVRRVLGSKRLRRRDITREELFVRDTSRQALQALNGFVSAEGA